jgi:DNA-binding MarR family transcriptional regulator
LKADTRPLSSRLGAGEQSELREMFVLLYSALGHLQAMRRLLAGQIGLDASEFAVVMALDHLERSQRPTRVRDIAAVMHAAAANVTATIRKLQEKGWVHKEVSQLDSRALTVRTTERAKSRINELRDDLVSVNDVWIGDVDIEDIRAVGRVCSALIDRHPQAMATCRALKRG